jgi:MFS transporter, ACS family, solute carrier family 17 (sodium-dependent inorganic phosphate cotransporter), member 9
MTFELVGVLCLVWTYFFFKNVVIKARDRKMLTDKDADNLINNKNQSVPWAQLMSKASFISLIIAHVCQNNAYYILLTWLPTYFQESYPGSKGWIFNVVPWLISLPATIFAGWLADDMISKSKFLIFF